MMRLRFLLPAVAAVMLTSCGGIAGSGGTYNITLESQNGSKTVSLSVEVADTFEERERGLMEREQLPQNQGMLFAFEQPDVLKFWMQNTLIPLDIMYFTGAGEFINAHQMVPCEEDPCPTYNSAEPAQFAVEVNAGFREEHGIGPGWRLKMKDIAKVVKFK